MRAIPVKTFIKSHPLLMYFARAFAVSWGGMARQAAIATPSIAPYRKAGQLPQTVGQTAHSFRAGADRWARHRSVFDASNGQTGLAGLSARWIGQTSLKKGQIMIVYLGKWPIRMDPYNHCRISS